MSAIDAGRRARMRRDRIVWIVAVGLFIGVLLLLFIWPAVMLILGAFRTGAPGQPGQWTIHGLVSTYTSGTTWRAVLNSVILSISASVISTSIGVFLAWVATRTTAPLRRLITPTLAIALTMPPLFFSLGWVMLANKENGSLNKLFDVVTGSSGAVLNVLSWPGLILLMGVFLSPVPYFLSIGPLQRVDGSLEEAARMTGAGALRVFWSVTLPVISPALIGIVALQLSGIFAAFDLPLLLGVPAHILVFSTQIYTDLNATFIPAYSSASSLSIILAVLVGIVLFTRQRLLGRRDFATISGRGYRPEPRDHGRIQWLFALAFVVIALIAFVLPLSQIVLGSFQPLFGLYSHLTLDNYRAVFSSSSVLASIRTTFVLAIVGGFAGMLLATVIAYIGLRSRRQWLRNFLQIVTWTPWAIPGVVLGLAFLWAYIPIPVLKQLYNTVWLLLIGFVVEVVPIASRAADGALAQVSEDLEESARVSGAGRVRAFGGIVLRLITPSFMAGWFLCALFVAGDLSLPILLASPTLQTSSVVAYNLYANGNSSEAAAVFCVVTAVIALAFGVASISRFFIRRAVRQRRVAVRAAIATGPTSMGAAGAP